MQNESNSQNGKPLGKRILSALGITLVCVIAVSLGVVGRILSKSKTLTKAGWLYLRQTPPQKVFGQNQLNLLVLGCDVDYTPNGKMISADKARSDMMMLTHLDFDRKEVSALSIARDIYYKMPGKVILGKEEGHKINSYHKYGGNQLAKEAVEGLLGVKIDRVVTINFDAFQKLVNVVGGVDITVDKPLVYDDNAGHLHINLKPGPQHVNGYQAMGFVRYRHGDSDLLRQRRQQQFIMALEKQIKSNPGSIADVANMGQEVLGNEFSDEEAAMLAIFAQKIDRKTIKFGQVPVLPSTKSNSTMLYMNTRKVSKVLASLGFTGDDAATQPVASNQNPATTSGNN